MLRFYVEQLRLLPSSLLVLFLFDICRFEGRTKLTEDMFTFIAASVDALLSLLLCPDVVFILFCCLV